MNRQRKRWMAVLAVAGLALGLQAFGAGTNYVWLSAPSSAPPYATWGRFRVCGGISYWPARDLEVAGLVPSATVRA